MFDHNFEFGNISISGSSGSSNSAQGYIKDMGAEAHLEHGTPYRIVVIPAASVTGNLNVDVIESDEVSGTGESVSMTSPVTTNSFIIENPEKGEKYSFHLPVIHKRYLSVQISGEVAVEVYAVIERLTW